MTNEEIVKALNCCNSGGTCKECPLFARGTRCVAELIENSASLLESQQKRIEELEARQRWIAVSERMPEEHTDVLVCGTEAIGNVKYLCAVKCLDGDVFRPLSAPSVHWTHWMPLPAPPEKG